jgi:DNA-binding NarL/FixJ family response regulator
MTRVSIVSASPAVRAGLRALLASVGGVDVVNDGPTVGLELTADVEDTPDVLVADVGSLDELDDLVESVERVDAGLVVLGPSAGADRLAALVPSFAWGYLTPAAGAAELGAAIQAVAVGLVALDPNLVGGGSSPVRPLPTPAEPIAEGLTQREREVLNLVAEGLTNKAIALRLSVSDHTVKFHIASILAKLGAGSRTEAVHLAARHGLIAL